MPSTEFDSAVSCTRGVWLRGVMHLQSLTPRCHTLYGVWLRGVMPSKEFDSAVSCIRGVWFPGVLPSTDFDSAVSLHCLLPSIRLSKFLSLLLPSLGIFLRPKASSTACSISISSTSSLSSFSSSSFSVFSAAQATTTCVLYVNHTGCLFTILYNVENKISHIISILYTPLSPTW